MSDYLQLFRRRFWGATARIRGPAQLLILRRSLHSTLSHRTDEYRLDVAQTLASGSEMPRVQLGADATGTACSFAP